ncbi:MAG: TonB-dependent receptor [Flavobacteriaceae bacterium]|nr:TonB-dependent receptor [Flavobacteriaceae bacterium]
MKKYVLAIMLLVVGVTYAQVKVTGVIKDSIGNPLEMANVIALNKKTNALDSYGFTDAKGRYKLTLKLNASYSIKASFIGYKTSDVLLETKEKDIVKDISLKEDATLDEVNITYKIPVSIKGDTLVYDADSFKAGTEKKLGDVLKRLPGVEVNSDGEIKVEGKSVGKIMVEGKDFFDGDTKVATQNIPANAIDKVQVLKNFSEVNQLKGVQDNSDNLAINIKLKEGKKNFWFGEITAGVGGDNRYLAHPKLFYYSPKYSINLLTDLNNIGKMPFTRRDYFRFTGGFRPGGNSGTGFNVASSDIGFLTMQNNRAKEIEAKFAAANFSYSPKKTWDISGFAIYSGTKTELEQGSTRNYINNGVTETTTSNSTQDSNLGLFKLSSSYKPNANNHFDYDIFSKVSNQKENQLFTSSQIPGSISQAQSQNPFSVNQNLNYYYTLNDKNIFAFSAQHLWQDEDPFYNAKLQQLSFANLLTLTTPSNGNPYDVSQNKRVKTNKFDAKLDYYYVINSKSNINFNAGLTSSNQKFNSSVFETLNSAENAITTPSTINDVDYSFNDLYVGVNYKFITGIFTFDQGFTLHSYSAKNTQLGSVRDDNFTKLLPNASVKLQLKKSETLRLSYRQMVNFTDINSVAAGYVFNNYNRLYSGNRNLESSYSHNLNLNYFSFNMFNYTNVFAFINYNKRINSVTGSILPINGGVEQVSSSTNTAFPNESLTGNANLQKTIGKIKGSLGMNLSLSKSTNTIVSFRDTDNNPNTPPVRVEEERDARSFSQTYSTGISSNFRIAPNFDFGYRVTVNDYNQGGNANKFYTHSPYLNLDVLFLKNFTFTSRYTYNNYKNETQTLNNYSFLDLDLTYQKKDSKWEYSLEVTNALNTASLNRDSTNAIFNSSSTYVIQPRFTVFTIKYNL